MGSIRVGFALLVLASISSAKDVFRYTDEETGQSHYMMGEPGKSVEGGWSFKSGDQDFELTYKADEAGFQPEAVYIPVPVEDTDEVALAKSQFYSLFEEAKMKALEAGEEVEGEENTIVDVEKRDAEPHHGHGAHGFRRRQFYTHPKADVKYTYDPFYGFKPVEMKEGSEEMKEQKLFKFVPYRGFVPDVEGGEAEQPLFKMGPYRGFVPATKEEADESKEMLFKLHPYYGYVPATMKAKEGEEATKDEAMKYAFHPRFGYVPQFKEMKPEAEDEKEYVFNPFYGFIPADKVKEDAKMPGYFYRSKMSQMKFKFVRGYGFVPKVAEEKKMEEEAKVAEEKVEGMKKRSVDEAAAEEVDQEAVEVKEVKAVEKNQKLFALPYAHTPFHQVHRPLSYQFNPYHGFVPMAKEEEGKEAEPKLYKYVPYYGFVPVSSEKMVEEEEKKEVLYKYIPYRGFVQVKEDGEEDEEAAPKHPLEEQEYRYDPFLGFVPITAKKDQDGEKATEEEEEKAATEVKRYKFHPYYGFVEIKDEDEMDEDKKAEPLYKFVPYYGFVPASQKSEEEDAMAEAEMPATKHHHISYSFHPYFGYLPTVVKSGETKKEQLYRHDPVQGFVPVEEEEEAMEEAEEDVRKKRDAQTFIYPQNFLIYPNYQPLNIRTAMTQEGEETQQGTDTVPASTVQLQSGNQPAILPGPQPVFVPGILVPHLPVVVPGGQALFSPQIPSTKPNLPLPENQFPVFPNDPETEKQGAFEF